MFLRILKEINVFSTRHELNFLSSFRRTPGFKELILARVTYASILVHFAEAGGLAEMLTVFTTRKTEAIAVLKRINGPTKWNDVCTNGWI
jgi:hypothetical protein